jgi:2-oxoglutarate dehydrogenase E2 component (dihydrolipoamide succinyltransferase)
VGRKIVVPEMGESVVEARVGRWLKREGEPVAAGDPVVALETEKVDLEIAAEESGILAHINRQEGEEVKIGDVLGVIEGPPPSGPAPGTAAPEAGPTDASRPVSAPPPVARSETMSTPAEPKPPHTEPKPAHIEPVAPAPSGRSGEREGSADATGRETRLRMSRRRQTIARRLVEAQQTAAMLTTFNEIDMGAVQEIRRQRKDSFSKRHGVGLGITSFFVKACIAALKSYPRLNAEIQGEEMVLKQYYDIGIAVGAAEGLVVPVLRDADRLSIVEIEQGLKGFAKRAEAGTLSLEDLRGGTFTITNGGVFGSLLSTPVLNPPQVAILGLHKTEMRPVALEGSVVIRPMMYTALTYDHRIVDGREAVQFLARVKELIEQPEDLFLEG